MSLPLDDHQKAVYTRLEHAVYRKNVKGVPVAVAWNPNRRSVGDVLDALAKGVTLLPATVNPPAWTGLGDGPPVPVVACANGLLSVTSRTRHPHSPQWFNLTAVPFDYDADAAPPSRWLAFLHQLWPDDPESIAALQQWFGYVLAGITAHQKALLIVGPRRGGKGTIAGVLRALLGPENVKGPTLASLSEQFGLQPLIGASLAVIADARLDRNRAHVAVERLLSITGEDVLTVDRKYTDAWTGKMPTRIMMLSNELPSSVTCPAPSRPGSSCSG